jgi:hypothetical protein
MSDAAPPSGYERSDADPRLIGALALGIAVFLILTPYLLLALYPDAVGHAPVAKGLPQPPAPRLQVHPRSDLERLRADDQARLESYGWADRQGGIVRIPIEQAMRLLAERGLPGWPRDGAATDSSAPR